MPSAPQPTPLPRRLAEQHSKPLDVENAHLSVRVDFIRSPARSKVAIDVLYLVVRNLVHLTTTVQQALDDLREL